MPEGQRGAARRSSAPHTALSCTAPAAGQQHALRWCSDCLRNPAAFILGQTRFGKSLYAIGGNDQAARVAGINVERNLVLTYVWCGVLAALAGVLLAGRAGSADPATSGLNYELDAIAAATVGGTSHTGGICKISGVLCGILILGVINNGLVLLGVNDNYTNIIKGIIIVGAVALDMKKNTRKA